MKKTILLFIAAAVAAFCSKAQDQHTTMTDLENVSLPSPTAAALKKYGDLPVGTYTGTPNVNIPLFDLTSGKLKFPVALSYAPAGARINDIGSSVGIGWVLSTTCAINRTMMGNAPDEGSNGYFNTYPIDSSMIFGIPAQDIYYNILNYESGVYDAQPDVFNVNAGDLNGKFVFDTLQNAHFMPYQHLSVVATQYTAGFNNPVSNALLIHPFSGFTIIDNNGTRYQFSDIEWSYTDPTVYTKINGSETATPNSSTNPFPSYPCTWYLTNIISADNVDTIHFSYNQVQTIQYLPGKSEVHAAKQISGNAHQKLAPYMVNRTLLETTFNSLQLSAITFRNGKLLFYENSSRLDLQGGKALDSIVLQDNKGSKIKSYALRYSYMHGAYMTPAAQTIAGSQDTLRMFLQSVQETGNNVSNPPYQLTYEHSIGLPSKRLSGGDLYGLANGKYWNYLDDSLPKTLYYDNLDSGTFYIRVLKSSNFNYAKQGALTAIQYPTSGSTQFLYEPHFQDIIPVTTPYQSCEGNMTINFTGIDFATPLHPDDPDAPGPKKFHVSSTVTFNVTTSLDANYIHFPTYYYIEIRDSASNALKYTYYNGSNYCTSYSSSPYPTCIQQLTLTPGTYLIIPKNTGTNYPGSISDISCRMVIPSFNCTTQYITTIDSLTVGGLRLKQITDVEPVTGRQIARQYEYALGARPDVSMGDFFLQEQYVWIDPGMGESLDSNSDEIDKTLYSSGLYPIVGVMGSYIGYGDVKEKRVDLTTGRTAGYTEYFYDNEIDDDLISNSNFQLDYTHLPYPPYVGKSWKRAQLLRKTDYKETDVNTFRMIRDETRSYSAFKVKAQIYGDAFFQVQNIITGSVPVNFLSYQNEWVDMYWVNHAKFYHTSEYNTLDSVVTKEYDDVGNAVVHKNTYDYDTTTLLPVRTTTYNSKGDLTKTIVKYPGNFSGLTSGDAVSQGIVMLQTSKVSAAEIERSTYRCNSDSSDNRLISSVFNTYKTNTPIRDGIYLVENTTPLYDFSPASITGGAITMDSRYQKRVFLDKYDVFSNICQQHKSSDQIHSYFWDYQHMYPVCEVSNSDTSDIAYTSFEADGSGNWTIGSVLRLAGGVTGDSSYELSNGAAGKSGLNSGSTYVVSYWTQNTSPFSIAGTIAGYPVKGKTVTLNGNSWTYYEHRISGQTTISLSGSGHIDELRLYPAGARMTTYTYNPLVGMTSQCDVGNRVTYYEYDGLQRLKRIRDQDNNILKSFDYQYQASSGCGSGCFSVAMQTFAGTNTLGYPVGVFDVHSKLLGNATGPSQYVSLWNADTADARIGTLSTGTDSVHFNITLNTGMNMPAGVTGMRYYQADLSWNQFDGVRNMNASYVDFGDGTGMHLGATPGDIVSVLAPNTTYNDIGDGEYGGLAPYYIHTYPDTTLKTLTFYHSDSAMTDHLDNAIHPATSLTKLKNLRGNLPQNMWLFGSSCYQQASMNTVASISNWNSIHSVTEFNINNGDGVNPSFNMSYAQDFMQYNRGLNWIQTSGGPYGNGYRDTTFKISRLKSDWNTYFTNLNALYINDEHWNREDLSGLMKLQYLRLSATTQNHQDDPNSPLVPIPSNVLDNIFNQIAAGAGQTVSNGLIQLYTGGTTPTASSATARQLLLSKGWEIDIY